MRSKPDSDENQGGDLGSLTPTILSRPEGRKLVNADGWNSSRFRATAKSLSPSPAAAVSADPSSSPQQKRQISASGKSGRRAERQPANNVQVLMPITW